MSAATLENCVETRNDLLVPRLILDIYAFLVQSNKAEIFRTDSQQKLIAQYRSRRVQRYVQS